MEQFPSEAPSADTSRRQLVVLGAATVFVGGALTACGDDGAGTAATTSPTTASDTETDLDTESDLDTEDDTPDPTGTGVTASDADDEEDEEEDDEETTAARTTSPKKTTAKPAEDFSKGALVKLSSVPVGGSVKVGGVIVTRTGSNSVVGLDTTCTHRGCSVVPKGSELLCPCHDSRFNSRTGAVLGGPAPSPLAKIGLVVKGGYVHRG